MILPMLLAFDLIKMSMIKSKKITRMILYFISILALILIRMLAMNFTKPKFQEPDNPAAFQDLILVRAVNYNYHYFLNIWLLLAPDWLCFDWSMGCISLIRSFRDWRIILIVAMWSVLTSFCVKVLLTKSTFERRLLQYSIILGALPFVPASNILVNVGFVIAERNLYLSVLGYVMVVSLGYRKISIKWRRISKFSLLILMATFLLKCQLRSKEWENEDRLFK